MDFHDLTAMEEDTLEVLCRCEVALVSIEESDNLRQPFEELFNLIHEDSEKPLDLQKGYAAISDTAFFFVEREEMPDFDAKPDFEEGKLPADAKKDSPFNMLISLLKEWGGLATDKIMSHVDPENLSDVPEAVNAIFSGCLEDQEALKKLSENVETAKKSKDEKETEKATKALKEKEVELFKKAGEIEEKVVAQLEKDQKAKE
jgi:hypothetical protein